MPKTVEEVVEELSDKLGIYECKHAEFEACNHDPYGCRNCFNFYMTNTIIDAVKTEIKLGYISHA